MTSTAEFLKQEEGTAPEGKVAKAIEKRTMKLPSDLFLWSAVAAIGGAAILRLMGKKDEAIFVGEWVAPFMLLGIYNKIVKVAGSDREERGDVTGRLANFHH